MNNQTMFNVSGLYSGATVVYSNGSNSPVEMQKAIDDNPESSITVSPSKNESGMIISYGESRQIQRISVMADPAAKTGKLEFFLMGSLPAAASAPATTDNTLTSQYMKVANPQAGSAPTGAVSLENLSPNATLVLGHGFHRAAAAAEFPAVSASYMIVRWTPEAEGQSVSISEINSFADLSLNDFELVSDMPAIADGAADASKDSSKDSKDKQSLPPVGDFLPGKDPFLPGGLGFPPEPHSCSSSPAEAGYFNQVPSKGRRGIYVPRLFAFAHELRWIA